MQTDEVGPRLFRRLALAAAIAWLWAPAAAAAGAVEAERLKTEYRENPLGIDRLEPRLGWVLASKERGQRQTAFRVLAASAPGRLTEKGADLWDSGKVMSDETVHVVYRGRPLKSGERVYWRVRVWDRDGEASAWSEAAWFEMGLLKREDWGAKWISAPGQEGLTEEQLLGDNPAPLLRKDFRVQKPVKRARVYVSGLGYYELRLNGRRVGDHVLDPGWTTYAKRALYSTYDVTRDLRRGDNALGVMLGNGWFNPLPLRFFGRINLREHLTIGAPRVLLRLEVEYADGSTDTVVTDESWKSAPGPVIRNNVYLGEVYDAREEKRGWDEPGYRDPDWKPAVIQPHEPLGDLRAQDAPPIRVKRRVKAVRLTEPKPGVFVFDLGQNLAGWVRLRVNGPAGTRVTLRYGELLYPNGMLNGMTAVACQMKQGGPDYRYDGQGVPRTAFQQDQYILAGGGEETWSQRFTFHGFRYVEVTGYPGKPTLDAIEGLLLHSDVPPAGSFECSNPMFNRIQEMVLWTELSNLFSVQSDCPHREKFGYGGDIVAASEMGILNFDMSRFYAKAVADLQDAVRPNGGFTETAPYVGISDEGLGENSGPVGWGTAHPLLLWQLYQYYGDRGLLEEQYAAARKWLELLRSKAPEGILDNGISDHESLVPKPRALTGTGFYYLNATLLARIARVLGREAEAREYEALAKSVRAAFNARFLQAGTGRYGSATQASQAFALHLGLAPEEESARALEVLVRDIEDTHKGHLSTGIFGTKYMLNALTDLGRADVACRMVSQPDFPGWGHMLNNGATTLWEHWEFSDNVYSHNHPMFGSVSEWFFEALAGIRIAPDAVGFDRMMIAPEPVGGLEWARGRHESVRGTIASEWRREGGRLELRVTVPTGTTALVSVPCSEPDSVRESGRPLKEAKGVRVVRREPGKVIVEVEGGKYVFVSDGRP